VFDSISRVRCIDIDSLLWFNVIWKKSLIRDWGALLFTEDFRKIGSLLTLANPRMFAVLEGGYFIPDLGANVHAFLKGMQEACF